MALTAQEVALRLKALPSPQQRELTALFGKIIADVAAGGAVPATTAVAGVMKQTAHQANSVAADVPTLVTDFNALLAKLQAAGHMA